MPRLTKRMRDWTTLISASLAALALAEKHCTTPGTWQADGARSTVDARLRGGHPGTGDTVRAAMGASSLLHPDSDTALTAWELYGVPALMTVVGLFVGWVARQEWREARSSTHPLPPVDYHPRHATTSSETGRHSVGGRRHAQSGDSPSSR